MFKHVAIEKLESWRDIRVAECELFAEDKDTTVAKFKEQLERELTFVYENIREYYNEIVSNKERFLNRNPIYTLKYNKENAMTARGLCVILAEHGRFLDEYDLSTKESVHEINRGLQRNLKNHEPEMEVDYPHLLNEILAKIEKNHAKAEEKQPEMVVAVATIQRGKR